MSSRPLRVKRLSWSANRVVSVAWRVASRATRSGIYERKMEYWREIFAV